MTVHPIHATLVRVDSHDRERFVALNRLGIWTDDKTGRAVCPETRAAITVALKRS